MEQSVLNFNTVEEKVNNDMVYFIHFSVDDDGPEERGNVYDKIAAITNDGKKAYELYLKIDDQTVLNKIIDIREVYGYDGLVIGYTIDHHAHELTKTYYVDINTLRNPDEKALRESYVVRIDLASIPKDRLLI